MLTAVALENPQRSGRTAPRILIVASIPSLGAWPPTLLRGGRRPFARFKSPDLLGLAALGCALLCSPPSSPASQPHISPHRKYRILCPSSPCQARIHRTPSRVKPSSATFCVTGSTPLTDPRLLLCLTVSVRGREWIGREDWVWGSAVLRNGKNVCDQCLCKTLASIS